MAQVEWVIVGSAALTTFATCGFIAAVRRYWMGLQSRSWPTVPGRVTDCRMQYGATMACHVEYEYVAGGDAHDGNTLQVGHSVKSRKHGEALLERYATGTEVEVRYDPADPAKAVLIPGVGSVAWTAPVAAAVLMVVGVALVGVAALHRIEPAARPVAKTPVARPKHPASVAVARDGTVYVCDQDPDVSTTTPFMPTAPAYPDYPTTTRPYWELPTTSRPESGRLRRVAPDMSGYTPVVTRTLDAPIGLAVQDPGKFYVTDDGQLWVITVETQTDKTRINLTAVLNGLPDLGGVAVDSAGNAYVASAGRVLELRAGEASATEILQVPDGGDATDVAVDSGGNVFVTDQRRNRVLRAAPGSRTPVELPFANLAQPQGIAVDTAGTVYVVDSGNRRVLRLLANATVATDVSVLGVREPYDVALGNAETLYVTNAVDGEVSKFHVQP